MEKKTVLLTCFIGLLLLTGLSGAFAEEALTPEMLVGKWEGDFGNSHWSSDFFIEIFDIDLKKKQVLMRHYCPNCINRTYAYTAEKLLDKKN